MFGFGKKPAPGCGGCVVKSFGNCKSHLTPAAKIIAEGFVGNGREFSSSNPEDIEIVAAILAEDMQENGKHVAYKIPEDQAIQNDFFDLIRSNINNIKAAKLGLG